ncbi:MAG TPA: DUF1972 domain-containing protein [Alphaproteobacteria bacterium]
MTKQLIILGTHGIPARHGGFETFTERMALYLIKHGWQVTVMGQADEADETSWNDIQCIYLKKRKSGFLKYLDPLLYDMAAIWHTRHMPGIILTLGYNTAIFNLLPYFLQRRQIINMDGLEWKRSKYKYWHEKLWLRLNEWVALRIADTCIADHPEIASYLLKKSPHTRIKTIAYGADIPRQSEIDIHLLDTFHVKPHEYGLIIARAEPENQIADMVHAWKNAKSPHPLLIVGKYDRQNKYQNYVLSLADDRIKFIGAIYDPKTINTLRSFTAVYLHGHQVGGTNPSLVEAMAAASPIIAHDNPFNRHTTGHHAFYFELGRDLTLKIDYLLDNRDKAKKLGHQAQEWQKNHYRWTTILNDYRQLLEHSA